MKYKIKTSNIDVINLQRAKDNTNWTLRQIIRFLQYQKERVEKKEITAGTSKNFLKSLKVFCEMADIPLPWKILQEDYQMPDNQQTIELLL